MARRESPKPRKCPTQTCPLCSAQVGFLFKMEEHQRGKRCAGVRVIHVLQDAGLVEITGTLGAALIHLPQLKGMIKRGPPKQDPGAGPVAYWCPDWIVQVCSGVGGASVVRGFDDSSRFTNQTARLDTTITVVLERLAGGEEVDREIAESALRLGGAEALISMLGDALVTGREDYIGRPKSWPSKSATLRGPEFAPPSESTAARLTPDRPASRRRRKDG